MLVIGTEWSEPSERYRNVILKSPEFRDEISKSFVMLKIERKKEKPTTYRQRLAILHYHEMLERYRVEGIPTVVLMDPQGRPYTKKVGFDSERSAEYYVDYLKGRSFVLRGLDRFLGLAKKAKTLKERVTHMDAAMHLLDDEYVALHYRSIVDEIILLNADDKITKRYKNFRNLGDILKARSDFALNRKMFEMVGGNPKLLIDAEIELLDRLMKTKNPEPRIHHELLYRKGILLFSRDKKAAKRALLKAIEVYPSSPFNSYIKEMIRKYLED